MNKLYLILFITFSYTLLSIGECDNRSFCRDRTFQMTQNTGNSVHYLDVQNYDFHSDLRNGFTYESKFKLTQSSNLPDKIFLAGVWGPFEDLNDSWVLYINSQRELVFEINGPNTELGDSDNTKAVYNLADSLNDWHTVACVFDPSQAAARLYLNGDLKDVSTNSQYPATTLRRPSNSRFGMQIGSTNALFNENTNYLSFLGEMDEIKLWNTVRTNYEISCSMNENNLGSETGLSIYYRCNSDPSDFEICDVTDNGRTGEMRGNGARCANPSNPRWNESRPYIFTEEPNFVSIGNQLHDTIKCDFQKTYTWKFIDTGDCSDVNYFITGAKLINGEWQWNRNFNGLVFSGRQDIENGTEHTAQVTVNADFVGTERYRFVVVKDSDLRLELNSQGVLGVNNFQVCGRIMWNNTNIYLTRVTDAVYSKDSLDFGIILANCTDQPFRDDTFTITNNTIQTGTNEPLTINQIDLGRSEYTLISPALPISIQPGENLDIRVRFTSNNEVGIYDDTVKVYTTDRCEPFRAIPTKAEIRDVITIFAGENEIDSVDFGVHCAGPIIATQPFFWENLLEENIVVTDVIYPQFFTGHRPGGNGETLEPERAYQQKYFGFEPTVAGVYEDSIIVVIEAQGCRIERPIWVKGEALKPEYSITPIDTLDFGDVFIGQSRVMQLDVENVSINNTRYRNFLFQGDVFDITTGAVVNIGPNQTRNINIEFKPLEAIQYFDNVRVEDAVCFDSYRVAIKGRGVVEAFNFNPTEVRIDNITACKDSIVTLDIINTSGLDAELSDFNFQDPSGKFSILSPPNLLNSTVNLAPNEEIQITIQYDPSDLSGDRSDVAFLSYESFDEDWDVQITGTSIVPRLFMTEELPFGSLEVTTSKLDTVSVENITGADIAITGFALRDNDVFRIVEPLMPFDTILKPRELMEVVIEFTPLTTDFYDDSLYVLIEEPCEVSQEFAVGSHLTGFGEVIPLDISQIELSFGQVSPCDCETKTIPLRNRSRDNEIFIDSVWMDNEINSTTLTSSNLDYYTWEIGGRSDLPINIESGVVDSLYLTYCPRAPFILDSLLHNAVVHVRASGPGWESDDAVYLSGRQMLLFETTPEKAEFFPTSVDVFAVRRSSTTKIPLPEVNQNQDPIKIDSITFVPDERVFFYSSTFSDMTPFYFTNADSLNLDLDFRPRAPKDYKARMYLHISEPCNMIDSTVEVTGSGYAQPYPVNFLFAEPVVTSPRDTFAIPNCDTLRLPVYTSRPIPGEVVNISAQLNYDSLAFKFEGIDSYYLDTNCLGYTSSYNIDGDSLNRVYLSMKNFCSVDSDKPIFTAKFTPLTTFDRGSRTFSVDSIFFDTEEVILFDIAAAQDTTVGRVNKADFQILNEIDFGVVNVLDCVTDSIIIENTGDVAVWLDNLIETIDDVNIISVEPPYDTEIQPLENVKVVFEYCPTNLNSFSDFSLASVLKPCLIEDSTLISGSGFAPPYEISTDINYNYIKIDTIGGVLKEIINVPLIFEKDLMVNYNDVDYWMDNFEFDLDVSYNPRALKYISYTSTNYDALINPNLGLIELGFSEIDSLKEGELGYLTFEMTLSDSLFSEINIKPKNFDADIMFYDLQPINRLSILNSTGACNLSFLRFSDNVTSLTPVYPNPITNKGTIEFSTLEEAGLSLKIYNVNGELIKEYFGDNKLYQSNNYSVEINSKDYKAGVYFYVLDSGNFRLTDKMVISK